MSEKETRLVCRACFFDAAQNQEIPRLTGQEKKATRSSDGQQLCKVCGKPWETARVTRGAWNKWQLVQDRPEGVVYRVCENGINCNDDNCPKAHHPDELKIWCAERDQEFGVSAAKPRPFPDSIIESYAMLQEAKVHQCSSYHNYGRCQNGQHCTHSHSDAEHHLWRAELERRKAEHRPAPPVQVPAAYGGSQRQRVQVRPRPKLPWITHFKMCFTVRNGVRCNNGKRCTYAHSVEEQRFWNDPLNKLVPTRSAAFPGKNPFIDEVRMQVKHMKPIELMGMKRGIVISEESQAATIVTITEPKQMVWKFTVRCDRGVSRHLLRSVVLADPSIKNVKLQSAAHYPSSKLGQTFKAVPDGGGVQLNVPITSKDLARVKIVYEPVQVSVRQIVVFQFDGFKIGVPLIVNFTTQANLDMRNSLQSANSRMTSEDRARVSMIHSRSIFWEEQFEVVPYPHPPDCRANDALPEYRIPVEIEEQIKCGQYDAQETELTPANYKSCLHILLYMEEIERLNRFQRYDIYGANLRFSDRLEFKLNPNDKQAPPEFVSTSDDQFRVCHVVVDADVDDHELSLNEWCTAFLRPVSESSTIVYEAKLEKVYGSSVVLKVHRDVAAICSKCKVDIRFRLYRDDFRKYHHALDQLDINVVFPDGNMDPSDMPTPAPAVFEKDRLAEEIKHNVLNESQQAVLDSMLNLENRQVPTILSGPFGTGKTRSLVEAILLVLRYIPAAKILVCTWVNQTADHYVSDLHKMWKDQGGTKLSMFRFLSASRRIGTVQESIRHYCKIKENGQTFSYPDLKELMAVQCVVTTISNADELLHMNVPKNHFTHIVVDEAAQMIEPSCIVPLALASPGCKVVLAGDINQIEPVVQSPLARRYNLQRSLLERLYYTQVYNQKPMLRIQLLLNYRCAREILELASDLFYQSKVQHRHQRKPGGPQDRATLSFVNVDGQETRHDDSPSYFNVEETNEVVKEVRKFVEAGVAKEEIGVIAPYTKQVALLRQQLRKSRFGSVNVNTMRAVQGNEYRVLIISTVRTCGTDRDNNPDDPSLGFLAGPKLFNTLITRAGDWLVVIGKALTLVSVGNNRGNWCQLMQRCDRMGSYMDRSGENQTLTQLMERENSLRDLVENATNVPVAMEKIRASELPENRLVLEQFKSRDPAVVKKIFWRKLEGRVRETIPDGYHHVLGLLTTRYTAEDLLDMASDSIMLKHRSEDAARELGLLVDAEAAEQLSPQAMTLADGLNMPVGPGAVPMPHRLTSQLSADIPEFVPRGTMMLQQSAVIGDASSQANGAYAAMPYGSGAAAAGVNGQMPYNISGAGVHGQTAPPDPTMVPLAGSGNAVQTNVERIMQLLDKKQAVLSDLQKHLSFLQQQMQQVESAGTVPQYAYKTLYNMLNYVERNIDRVRNEQDSQNQQHMDHTQFCQLLNTQEGQALNLTGPPDAQPADTAPIAEPSYSPIPDAVTSGAPSVSATPAAPVSQASPRTKRAASNRPPPNAVSNAAPPSSSQQQQQDPSTVSAPVQGQHTTQPQLHHQLQQRQKQRMPAQSHQQPAASAPVPAQYTPHPQPLQQQQQQQYHASVQQQQPIHSSLHSTGAPAYSGYRMPQSAWDPYQAQQSMPIFGAPGRMSAGVAGVQSTSAAWGGGGGVTLMRNQQQYQMQPLMQPPSAGTAARQQQQAPYGSTGMHRAPDHGQGLR